MNIRYSASVFFIIFSVLILTVPQLADARAGSGGSVGSRGSRTYSSSPSASPITRSTTAPSTATPYAPAPNAAPYNNSSHPFLSSLAGGLFGAGLANMLFGGGYGGSGMGLLPMLLLAGAIYFIYKRTTSGTFVPPAPPSSVGTQPYYNPYRAELSQPVAITGADKDAFEKILYDVQKSWSSGDLNHMRQIVTPEILQYFSEQLAANSSRGLLNKVEQVQMQHAEMVEAWNENAMDYATVRFGWTALDYMVRLDREPYASDYVESGSNTQPQPAEEIWTFMRASGGHWLLSAIQQVR